MNSIEKTLIATACGFSVVLAASGAVNKVVSEDYYQAIVERKAFGLKDPPPPPKPDPVKPTQVTGIKLSGITTLWGVKKAYLVVPDPEKQPPNPANNRYPCIKEGEEDFGIKVLQIDEIANSVKILNNGMPMELTFAANGNTANPVNLPGPTGAPVPGMNPAMAMPAPIPMQNVPPPPGINRGPTMVTPPVNIPNQFTPNQFTPNNTIPPRQMRSAQANPAADQAALALSSLQIEIQREANKSAIASGAFPPLPPTDLNEAPAATQTAPHR